MKNKAIFALYPNVIRIGDKAGAFDKDNNKISIDEKLVNEKIAELEALEPMRLLRLERNRRLSAVDWWTSRALDGIALTEAQKTYRQKLRDLPKMITPDDSTEPLPAPTIDPNGQLVFDHWPEYNEDK